MNVENKITKIKNYLEYDESKFQADLQKDLSELDLRKKAIEEKYNLMIELKCSENNDEKERLNVLCERAKTLVDGIHRKLFRKKHRSVVLEDEDIMQEPENILSDLECEIGKFEASSLPYGIRQFFDSVSLLFKSNYGQAEVDKIMKLYQAMMKIQEKSELDKKLNDELSRLDKAQFQEICSVDRIKFDMIDEKVDRYTYGLMTLIFANNEE